MKRVAYAVICCTVFSCSPDAKTNKELKKTITFNEPVNINLSASASKIAIQHFEAIYPLNRNSLNNEAVELGQILFNDKRLSKDGSVSCNSCHNLKAYGVDNLPTSPGDEQQNGDRNSPTVLNSGDHIAQFWDGRAASLEDQAGMPILNPIEMNIPNEQFLVERLSNIKLYQNLFTKAFPKATSPISFTNIKTAIGAFERTLVTPSRFDEFVQGNNNALTNKEKQGLAFFVKTGCTSCHNGKLLGASSYQKFGVTANYWDYTNSKKRDKGRFAVTGNQGDSYVFKVPSLRNVNETYPYFHDGSVEKLSDAVWIMARVQLDKDLSEEDVDLIVKFLETTTGSLQVDKQTPTPKLAQNI